MTRSKASRKRQYEAQQAKNNSSGSSLPADTTTLAQDVPGPGFAQTDQETIQQTYAHPTSTPVSSSSPPVEAESSVGTSSPEHESRDVLMGGDTEKIAPLTRYFTIAPLSAVPGKSMCTKKTWCSTTFSSAMCTATISTRIVKTEQGKVNHLAICLVDQADHQSIISKIIDLPTVDDQPQVTLQFADLAIVKPPPTYEDKELLRRCTIQILDLSLNERAHFVRAVFERYGPIVSIQMHMIGMHQQAYIRYQSKDPVRHFYENWSVMLGIDCVRVIPLALSAEDREFRKANCLKLSGFPRGCTPCDLMGLIETLQAKAFYMPRNRRSYKHINYAYIYFDSLDVLEDMQVRAFSF